MSEENPTKESAPAKKEPESKKEPKKIELTDEELAERINKAVEKERKKHEADAETRKKQAEEEQAKKAGEFEKLYQSEVARAKELEARTAQAALDLKGKDVDLKLRDFLAADAKLRDYASAARYMRPLIQFDKDTSDADIDKAIKSVVEQYVKDNPRQVTPGTGTVPARGKSPGTGETKTDKPAPPPLRQTYLRGAF